MKMYKNQGSKQAKKLKLHQLMIIDDTEWLIGAEVRNMKPTSAVIFCAAPSVVLTR
jgi:hypothetical protein